MEHHAGVRVSRPPHGELLHQPPDLLLGGARLQGQDGPDAALRLTVQPSVPVWPGEHWLILTLQLASVDIIFHI